MRRPRNKDRDEADVNMTPMLDIVFIMLIFFIVTATFLNETGLDLQQPPDDPNAPDNPNPKPVITVYVDAKNRCAVDNRGTDCGSVLLEVQALLADKPGASVILRVDKVSQHGTTVTLKDGLDSAGLQSKIEVI